MRITMIGTGYVGLVSGACFSEFGHHVVCVDRAEDKIKALREGQVPIYEPGLEAMVRTNVEAGRLSFATDLEAALPGSDAVFIAVGTPSRRGDGHADLTYVHAAADELAGLMDEYTVIVTKSTVPVGTGQQVQEIVARKLAERGVDIGFDVASNPEFLREGSAIEDFMRPNRVVVGVSSPRAEEVLRSLYRPLALREVSMVVTDIPTAELIKYAANAFLATKITFINEIADLCEKVGADVQRVGQGIGMDHRIGPKFLHPGPGFGGSCFPKDTRALNATAEQSGVRLSIVESVISANDARKKAMAQRIIDACGGGVEGKTAAVLGLTFKPNTDDMRESPSLDIVDALQRAGMKIQAYDPEGMDEARPLMPGVMFCAGAYDAMINADVLVIVTEWNEFRALDLAAVKSRLARPVVVDLRNIYRPEDMKGAGFAYFSVGRDPVGL